ncbi:MAG: endolytic transglycosylase MltG [Micavibrio aeruginosavorus]|uniref:Endolytic murein transglycosylase n=1 Tax=Micavibrio aeruginosavorus TaxID=349221 RepID=A0A2W5HJY3_9BACT|nr:MAG: endolytic transglycosylase MltG [Micavibrio aeruginosavorus]
MKKFLLVIFAMGALSVSAGLIYATHEFMGPGPLTVQKTIPIPKGQGVRAMAAQLQTEGVISNQYVFILFSRLTGTYKTLQAGEYEFAGAARMAEVLSKISRGDIVKRSFTIPEGKTSFEIVEILKKAENLTGEIKDIPAEGSMLPNTYFYQTGDTRDGKVKFMQGEMKKTIDELWPKREAGLPFKTIEEAVTLASIVEKETGIASERKRVAGVFINRLKTGMLLQTDPTVIYGLTKGQHKNEGQGPLGRRLLLKDLAILNPYNTYINPGLPPGPIANPGRASLEAVLHPEKHNYLFFVADGKGGHVFAATLDEHNRNVAAWRQIRKAND